MIEPQKIPRDTLVELLKDAIKNCINVHFLEGSNPCLIKVGNDLLHLYIKNLTPAQLSNKNEDIWRVQLPKRKVFEKIKKDANMFVFLGYDANFDVYATWNPYWTKQRLNVGESVSFYSRLSLQKNASQTDDLIIEHLNHNNEVVLFKRSTISKYLLNIKDYFMEETKYVAIGSSLRKGKDIGEQAKIFDFDKFISLDQIPPYTKYIRGKLSTEHTVKNYIYCLKYLFDNNLFNLHKDLFNKVTDGPSLKNACKKLLQTDEVFQKDILWHGAIRAALNHYITFYLGSNNINSEIKSSPKISISSIDKYSFIEEIKDEQVISKIIQLLDSPEIEDLDLLKILSEYYGDRYNNQMTMSKWLDFAVTTNWKLLLKKIQNNLENSVSGIQELRPLTPATENRRGKLWTENEEELISLYFKQGYSFDDIASAMGRSEISIKMRLEIIGLIKYSYETDTYVAIK